MPKQVAKYEITSVEVAGNKSTMHVHMAMTKTAAHNQLMEMAANFISQGWEVASGGIAENKIHLIPAPNHALALPNMVDRYVNLEVRLSGPA